MTPQKIRVLVIDDEPQILRGVGGSTCRCAATRYSTAASGGEALRTAADHRPDVIRAGPGIARHVRDRGARAAPWLADRAGDRAFGAHGLVGQGRKRSMPAPTITSPNRLGWTSSWPGCGPRCAGAAAASDMDEPVIETSSFTVDLAAKKVTKNGSEVHLTPTEWGHCSRCWCANRGKLVGREELLKEVWGPAYAKETHYLRVYLAQLRRKLEDDPSRPVHLLTETGMGYRFQE